MTDHVSGAGFIASSPSQIEVNEIINKVDNGTRSINFTEFCQILVEKNTEADRENEYKVRYIITSLWKPKIVNRNVSGFLVKTRRAAFPRMNSSLSSRTFHIKFE